MHDNNSSSNSNMKKKKKNKLKFRLSITTMKVLLSLSFALCFAVFNSRNMDHTMIVFVYGAKSSSSSSSSSSLISKRTTKTKKYSLFQPQQEKQKQQQEKQQRRKRMFSIHIINLDHDTQRWESVTKGLYNQMDPSLNANNDNNHNHNANNNHNKFQKVTRWVQSWFKTKKKKKKNNNDNNNSNDIDNMKTNYKYQIHRLSAIHGKSLSQQELKQGKNTTWIARHFVTRGTIGCYLSHRQFWQHVMDHNNNNNNDDDNDNNDLDDYDFYYICLEDDVVVCQDFLDKVSEILDELENNNNNDNNDDIDNNNNSNDDNTLFITSNDKISSSSSSSNIDDYDNAKIRDNNNNNIIHNNYNNIIHNINNNNNTPDWDVLFLGALGCIHPQGKYGWNCIAGFMAGGGRKRQQITEHVHIPHRALGAHAYILSKQGAQKLLSKAWTVTGHVDVVAWGMPELNMYCIHPMLVYQSMDRPSTIGAVTKGIETTLVPKKMILDPYTGIRLEWIFNSPVLQLGTPILTLTMGRSILYIVGGYILSWIFHDSFPWLLSVHSMIFLILFVLTKLTTIRCGSRPIL